MGTTNIVDSAGSRNEWLTLALVAGIAAAVAVLYAPTLSGLLDLWQSSEYRHGALVLPISAYLLWRVRGALAAVKLAPWWPGIAVVALLSAAWWLARALDVQVVEQLATVLLIPASVAAVLGLAFLRRALFPLAFLVAAVPMGDGMLPLLMRVTADVSTALLTLVGVPVFRQGQFLALPGGNFEVAAVCAGLNYLVSGLMVGVLFAYLTYTSNWKRAVFVGVTAVTLVLANGVRAFVVMYVASATQLKYMAGADHVWFGWVLFGLVIVALFVIGARWADPPDGANAVARGDRTYRSALRDVLPLALVLMLVLLAASAQRFQADLGSNWKFLLPIGAVLIWVLAKRFGPKSAERSQADVSAGGRRQTAKVGAAVAAVAVVLAAGPLSSAQPERAAPSRSVALALVAAPGCSLRNEPDRAAWAEELPIADFAGTATYACISGEANASVAGYWGSGAGREVHLLAPFEWRNSPAQTASIALADGRELVVNELELPGRRIWYWYRIGDRTALTPVGAKLAVAVELLRSRETAAAVIAVETPSSVSPEAERRPLKQVAAVLAAVRLPPAHTAGMRERISLDASHAGVGVASGQ